MERLKKSEMLEITGTLETVNEAIMNNHSGISAEAAVEALVQCQEKAVFLGKYLENLGGEPALLVKIIEEYCVNLYKEGLALSNGVSYKNQFDQIRIQLSQLKQGIQEEIPEDRTQIVFLPYKADMWDSMESIWRAAEEDETCDAFVIPIPYFERKHDGSLGTLHYEGGCFPRYVPVASWEDYQLEENRPDIIYIHNPYDGQNLVTSVHPAFYAEKLKRYTSKLVYIPYYVGVDVRAEKQFCVLPGTIYADRVILESEEIRYIYIEEFQKFEQETGCAGMQESAKKRFLALGSPKYDKVLLAEAEGLKIPKEWLPVIRKTDEIWKKVVFYNTSIGALLNQKEKMLEKIKSVLELFKSHKEDIALLWRPHPLLESTIRSMLPQLWEEYDAIVAQYRQEEWGIYDDSPDIDRAVVVSSAYYGDMSSVTALYGVTDKPVMIQIVAGELQKAGEVCQYLLNGNDKELLCITTYNNIVSTVSAVDTNTLKRDWLCEYPRFEEGLPVCAFSYTILKLGLKTFFAPRWYVNGNHLAVYDSSAGQFEYIPLQKNEGRLLDDAENNILKKWEWGESLYYSNSPKFQRIFCYQGSLFLAPSSYPAIVKVDMSTREVSYYSEFVDEVLRISDKQGRKESYAFGDAVHVGTKIYITCRWSDLLVEFDMETCKSSTIQLSRRGYGNHTVQYDGSCLWLFSNDNFAVTRWNPQNHESRIFNHYPEEIKEPPVWQSVAYFDGYMVALLGNHERLPLKIDVRTGVIYVADVLIEKMSVKEKILSLCTHRNRLYFVTTGNKIYELCEWDGESRSRDSFVTDIEERSLHRNLAKYYADTGISVITESMDFGLDDYIDAVAGGLKINRAGQVRVGAGKRIHEYLKWESGAAPWKVRGK